MNKLLPVLFAVLVDSGRMTVAILLGVIVFVYALTCDSVVVHLAIAMATGHSHIKSSHLTKTIYSGNRFCAIAAYDMV